MGEQKAWERAQQLELEHWKEGFAKPKAISSSHCGEEHSRMIWERFEVYPSSWRGKDILDVGCGPTARLECFFSGSRVYGLDPLIKEYSSISGAKVDGYHWTMGHKAERYDEQFAKWFDVVVCLNALDHCDNPQTVLDNMIAYCKPGGIGIVSVDCIEDHDAMHPHAFQPQDVERMVLDAEWTIAKRAKGRSYPMMENGKVTRWLDGWTKSTMAYHWWLRKPRTEQ